MLGPIQAIAIDDEPSHLLAITNGLSAIGMPCIGYWFDRETSELCPAPPPNGLPYLRVVFTDLNLSELGGIPDTQSLWATIVNVLNQLISIDSGPYILVLWTRIGTKAEDVKEMLYERAESLEGRPCPLEVIELSKSDFLVSQPIDQDFNDGLKSFYKSLHENLDQLKLAVERSVASNPNLNAVSAWETRAGNAAAQTVNAAYNCAKSDASSPSNIGSSLQKVLAKIAVASSSPKAAEKEPAITLDAGMLDILIDKFGASVGDDIYKATIHAAIGDTVKERIAFSNDDATHSELNTFFHIDPEVASTLSWDRGVVISTKPLKSEAIGFNPSTLITSDFLHPVDCYNKEMREEITDKHQSLISGDNFVLVEVGTDCDHAQNKPRTRRYLVGLEIPGTFLNLAVRKESLRTGALVLLGPWKINNEIKYLLVSCRRFCAWHQENPPESPPKYRLRAAIVDKILYRYATWSTRPGIVEFR